MAFQSYLLTSQNPDVTHAWNYVKFAINSIRHFMSIRSQMRQNHYESRQNYWRKIIYLNECETYCSKSRQFSCVVWLKKNKTIVCNLHFHFCDVTVHNRCPYVTNDCDSFVTSSSPIRWYLIVTKKSSSRFCFIFWFLLTHASVWDKYKTHLVMNKYPHILTSNCAKYQPRC